jgi:hypothetical protein
MTITELKRLIDAIHENAPDAKVEATVRRTLQPGKALQKQAMISGVQYRDGGQFASDARIIIEVL